MSKRSLTDEQEIELCKRYLNGESGLKLAEYYSIHRTTVYDILKRRKQEVRDGHFVSPYTFDEHWMDSLDIPEKYYFLGMTYSDGCNCDDRNQIVISLQEKDLPLLEEFNKLLKSDRPILVNDSAYKKDGKSQINRVFHVTSKYFCNRMEELGAIPRKSLIIEWPKWLEGNKNIWSFIRGYVDGDGSVIIRNNKNGTYSSRMSIVGSKNFCEGLKIFLEKNNIYSKIYDKENDNSKELRIDRKDDSKRFLENIYSELSIYMERKYEKAKLVL